MDFGLRAVSRTVTATRTLLVPCLSPRTTTLGINLYQFHQSGHIRQYNIRHVITKKTPSGITNTSTVSNAVIGKTSVTEQAATSHDNYLEGQVSAPLQYIQHTILPGAYLEQYDIDEWRSNLILPPDTFWEKWRVELLENDAGGLRTAEKFTERWQNGQLETHIRTAKLVNSNGARKIFQCTRSPSLPLFGVRKVVSYGYTKVNLRLLILQIY
jgi:hypothetical protein